MTNFENLTLAVLSALFVATVTCVIYCKWVFRYWKKRNLMCFQEPTVPFGNALLVFRRKFVYASIVKSAYDLTKRKGLKHAGGFAITLPIYIPVDPDNIKCILQGFQNFSQLIYGDYKNHDTFSTNLAFVSRQNWRYLRAKLTPAFTPGKIRILCDGIISCAHQMQEQLESGDKEEVDIAHVASCFFADVIAVCAYGLDCNRFKDGNSQFITNGRKLIERSSKYRLIKILLLELFPKLSQWLGIRIYDKETSDFFINVAKDTAKFRKYNKFARKDLFQLMLDAETQLNLDDIDDEASNSAKIIKDMASQVFIFFVAGFETSSLTLTYCLYELTQNLSIQDKLREEIDGVLMKYEGKVTYDAIMEMAYLSQVVDETLRKYPAIPFLTRKCVKDYKMCQTTIEKGNVVIMSILGLHHDPDYYPDPEKFDPDRFSEENRKKIMPFTYLPFGEAPKNCPVYRFGLMQIKVGLVVLLKHYTFLLNKNTIAPIELAAGSMTLMPKSAILLDMKNRT